MPGDLGVLLDLPKRSTPAYQAGRVPRLTTLLRRAAHATYDAAEQADVLLINGSAPFGYDVAEARGLPSAGVYCQPMTPTGAFPLRLIDLAEAFAEGAVDAGAEGLSQPGGSGALSMGPGRAQPMGHPRRGPAHQLGHLPEPDRDATGPPDGPRAAPHPHAAAPSGLRHLHTAEVPARFAFSGLDEWERWSTDTNTTGPAIRALSPDEHTAFRAHITTAFAPFRVDRGYELPSLALCVAAL